jgi:hypothetical protein
VPYTTGHNDFAGFFSGEGNRSPIPNVVVYRADSGMRTGREDVRFFFRKSRALMAC